MVAAGRTDLQLDRSWHYVPAPLPADAGVTVEVSTGRAVIASTVMSRTAVAPNYLLFLWTGMAGLTAGDRRALVVEPGFCAPAAVNAVAGEIRRLIVSFGQRPGVA